MQKRKPRIISRAVAHETAKMRTEVAIPPSSFDSFVPKPKTRRDEVYDLIEDASCYWFVDEDGIPWIGKEDIEDRGYGVFVVRFRCPLTALYTRVPLNRVVEKVCGILRSDIRYYCSERDVQYVNGIHQRYYECVWIICEG